MRNKQFIMTTARNICQNKTFILEQEVPAKYTSAQIARASIDDEAPRRRTRSLHAGRCLISTAPGCGCCYCCEKHDVAGRRAGGGRFLLLATRLASPAGGGRPANQDATPRRDTHKHAPPPDSSLSAASRGVNPARLEVKHPRHAQLPQRRLHRLLQPGRPAHKRRDVLVVLVAAGRPAAAAALAGAPLRQREVRPEHVLRDGGDGRRCNNNGTTVVGANAAQASGRHHNASCSSKAVSTPRAASQHRSVASPRAFHPVARALVIRPTEYSHRRCCALPSGSACGAGTASTTSHRAKRSGCASASASSSARRRTSSGV